MAPDNGGVLEVETVTVTVDSLTNANNEPWDPAANTGLSNPESVTIVGYTQGTTYTVFWNHSAGQFEFATTADGSDPGSETDVGEVKVRVEGRR